MFFSTVLLLGCTTGKVRDTSDNALSDVNVVAFGECHSAGCDAARVEVDTPIGNLTGYSVPTNEDGIFFYDPYAEMVPAEKAMAIAVPKNSSVDYYKMRFSKQGYEDTWLDFIPDAQVYTYKGKNYIISRVPDVYMCRAVEVDTDGDGLCDGAEEYYGTSPVKPDSDNNGVFDDQEIYGTGSPFKVQTRSLLHLNINVSDFETSKAFYEMLGFQVLIDTVVNVTDPGEAKGLDLPPYSLRAAPMALGGLNGDGFLIDLIQFYSPFDSEPPHSGEALGMTKLDMQTENLAADLLLFGANNVSYEVVDDANGIPSAVVVNDPDGIPVHLSQAGEVNESPDYKRTISGPTVYVSNLENSLEFYKQLGFLVSSQDERSATLYVSNRRNITLVESDTNTPAYEKLNHLGIARVAIVTTNIDQDIEILKAAGVEFYTDQAILPSGPLAFLRYVCFEDPDGTVIELVEYL